MKNEVLLELAEKWERDAKTPDTPMDGSEDAKIPNARTAGQREGMRECADGLRCLGNRTPTGDETK